MRRRPGPPIRGRLHGWDYMGKDGVYGKGGHFTGIKGIQGAAA